MITPPASVLADLQADLLTDCGPAGVEAASECYRWALDVAAAAPDPLPDSARSAIAAAEVLLTARRHRRHGHRQLAWHLVRLATVLAQSWRDELTATYAVVPDYVDSEP